LTSDCGSQVLSIKGGDFTWNIDDVQPTLEDINISIKKGELFGVLGRVGAGKVCLSGKKSDIAPKFDLVDELAFCHHW